MDERIAILEWLAHGSGMSAKCMAHHMAGMKCDGSYPHDGGDFGRCEAFLEAVPSARKRVPEMASVNKYWAALAPQWETIRKAPDKYRAIQGIIRPLEGADPSIIRLGNGSTLRFGA